MDCVFDSSCSWELSELDDIIGNNPNMEASSVVDQGPMDNWSEQKHSIMMTSSTSSSKKQKIDANEQHVSCLVDGCMEDLSSCRDYHRRHRVCENHSKTPVVAIAGKEQRFCQQCSRFHSLGEFDQVKRSCRKRLDGHNRRRRKPRAESVYLNYGGLFSNHQGAKLLRFDGSPTTFGCWPDKQKVHVSVEDSPPAAPFSSPTAWGRKFPFLLDTDNTEYDKVNHPLTQVVVAPGAKGALSLLSKNTNHHHHDSECGQTNLVQPLGTNLQFNGSLNQNIDPLTELNNDDHLIRMIHFRAQGLLENEALSFSWE